MSVILAHNFDCSLAILKINGDELLAMTDDGAFIKSALLLDCEYTLADHVTPQHDEDVLWYPRRFCPSQVDRSSSSTDHQVPGAL